MRPETRDAVADDERERELANESVLEVGDEKAISEPYLSPSKRSPEKFQVHKSK